MALRPHRLVAAGLLGATLVFTTALPAPARAQEDGVTLDPGDPAAKEYSLPHAEARREASGRADEPTTQGSSDAELFGEGVSKEDGSATRASGDASEPSTSAKSAADEPTDADDTSAATAPQTAKRGGDEVEASGVGSTAVLVGGGLVALVLAAGGGVALRALRGPDQ